MTTPMAHTSPGSAPLRVAVDIGGTFTDVVLWRGDERHTLKVLTTPQAPERGMLEGIRQVLERAASTPADVDVLIHGTTLATNALIERKGARTAFLTNDGFRDVLALGDEKRFDHYDLDLEKPRPLVPRERRLGLKGRIAADGTEIEPLDPADIDRAIDAVVEAAAEAVAIGLLHAYANPAHEQAVARRLRERCPTLPVSLSSEVCPEIREYERFSTTVANAYVQPLMSRYLAALRDELSAWGLRCPLFLVTSGGGLTSLETAMRFPIRLVESGPAGGAILSARLARDLGLAQALSFDMGGTTAKICFITDGRPEPSRRFEVARAWKNLKGSGWPVRIPVTEMVEIGAGGGSIARVDRLGRIAVGPDSAGAQPGPVCYGRGGQSPTVTDAQLLLGRLDAERFAGGRLRLDAAAAGQALRTAIADPQGLDLPWAAGGVLEIVEENMANAARVHAIERGKTVSQCTLIAFGGAAPLHAASMARRLDIGHVVIPRDAGVGSAVGFLLAPMAFEVVRSLRLDETDFDIAHVQGMLDELEQQARSVVAEGAPNTPAQLRRWVDARYRGQGHELAIELPAGRLDAQTMPQLRADFESRYRTQYGVLIPGVPLEFLTWTVVASAELTAHTDGLTAAAAHPAAIDGERQVFDPQTGASGAHRLIRRDAMGAGAQAAGPALVVEDQTTTVVPAGWHAALDAAGHLHLRRETDS